MPLRRWSFLALVLVALPVVAAAPRVAPRAHLYLEAELPKADSTIFSSPPAIMLWFSQEPLPNTTEIRLLDANDVELPLSAVRGDPEDPFHFLADVPGTLPAGKYRVRWLTYSDDEPGGLLRDGTFAFVVGGP